MNGIGGRRQRNRERKKEENKINECLGRMIAQDLVRKF